MSSIVTTSIGNRDNTVTVTLERGSTIVAIKSVPAKVCTNCGEYILSEEVSEYLLQLLDQAILNGATLEMLNYEA